jgi:hypothetical protein
MSKNTEEVSTAASYKHYEPILKLIKQKSGKFRTREVAEHTGFSVSGVQRCVMMFPAIERDNNGCLVWNRSKENLPLTRLEWRRGAKRTVKAETVTKEKAVVEDPLTGSVTQRVQAFLEEIKILDERRGQLVSYVETLRNMVVSELDALNAFIRDTTHVAVKPDDKVLVIKRAFAHEKETVGAPVVPPPPPRRKERTSRSTTKQTPKPKNLYAIKLGKVTINTYEDPVKARADFSKARPETVLVHIKNGVEDIIDRHEPRERKPRGERFKKNNPTPAQGTTTGTTPAADEEE